jgi:hypothetical protein
MDVRRSARVATSFLVAIKGVDREALLRRGNISMTGVYFVTDAEIGDVGTMTWLTLSSIDRARTVLVMAYIVRAVRLSDIDGRELTGVAFEFIPENNAAAVVVQDFVRYVLSLRRVGPAAHGTALEAKAEGAPPSSRNTLAADPTSDPSVQSITLQTSWSVPPGETIFVDLFAPGLPHRLRLAARTRGVAEIASTEPGGKPTYALQLTVERQSERPAAEDDDVAEDGLPVDELLSALAVPPQGQGGSARAARPSHLVGVLSQISLATLLSLFEMEQLTGKLVVRTVGGDATFLFVRGGRIVDVEPLGRSAGPRERIGALMRLEEGSFEFYDLPVDRPDRLEVRTTALLLDLARIMDEQARGDEGEDEA